MNSSVQPSRRIASNLLWTRGGVVRNPVVGVAADGRILRIAVCAEPDRLPFTEFRSGMLVPGFPADWRTAFERLLARRARPLPALLAELIPEGSGGTVPGVAPGVVSRMAPEVAPRVVPRVEPGVAPRAEPVSFKEVPGVEPAISGAVSASSSAAVAAPALSEPPASAASSSPASLSEPCFLPAACGLAPASELSAARAKNPSFDPSEGSAAPIPFSSPSSSSSLSPSAPDLPAAGCLVVISGLDYRTLHLTAQSRIELLAGPR